MGQSHYYIVMALPLHHAVVFLELLYMAFFFFSFDSCKIHGTETMQVLYSLLFRWRTGGEGGGGRQVGSGREISEEVKEISWGCAPPVLSRVLSCKSQSQPLLSQRACRLEEFH